MRIERDLIGQREVPDNVYYGIQTLRALENFPITGHRVHPEFIRALGLLKAACAQANVDRGALAPDLGSAIVRAAHEVAAGRWDDQFVVDPIQGGAGTSLNMNANEVIANRALELLGYEKGRYDVLHPIMHVNMAQSTNDVVPTALRVALLKLSAQAVEELSRLSHAFFDKAREYADVWKVGRTHLQDAVPIALRRELEAYGRVLQRDAGRLRQAAGDLRWVNIGGTAVGTGLNADDGYRVRVLEILREHTGLDLASADDLVDATQNQDMLVALSHAAKAAAVDLSKIASDLRMMSSGPRAGLAEISLPAVQPGSSIMPGKVNPVIPEVVNQVAFQVMGNDLTVTLAAQAGQFELNVMLPVLSYNLIQSLEILRQACRVFRDRCVVGIKVNRERLRQQLESSIGMVTALNPYIGYEKATEVAKEALETGRPVWEIVRARRLLPDETLQQVMAMQGLELPLAAVTGPSV